MHEGAYGACTARRLRSRKLDRSHAGTAGARSGVAGIYGCAGRDNPGSEASRRGGLHTWPRDDGSVVAWAAPPPARRLMDAAATSDGATATGLTVLSPSQVNAVEGGVEDRYDRRAVSGRSRRWGYAQGHTRQHGCRLRTRRGRRGSSWHSNSELSGGQEGRWPAAQEGASAAECTVPGHRIDPRSTY